MDRVIGNPKPKAGFCRTRIVAPWPKGCIRQRFALQPRSDSSSSAQGKRPSQNWKKLSTKLTSSRLGEGNK
jgi:hypothetical protein